MLSKNKRFRGNHRTGNAAMPSSPERKRSLKLALFAGLAESFASPEGPALAPSPTAAKSPRSFDDGAVGLGIVAAMSGDAAAEGRPPPSRPAPPARSEPIPIVSPRPAARPSWEEEEEEEEGGEMSESYTCVISHVGGNPVRKRVYFDDGSEGIERNFGADAGVFFQSPPPLAVLPPPTPAEGFLSCCYLCRKRLHGLDIFMYRGEKAFCSVECRCQQILSDEHRDKCGSRSRKKPFDYSVSPCPAPLLFAAGVAVA